MGTSLWIKFKWLVNVYRELIKNSHPLANQGRKLMIGALLAAPSSGLVIQFLLPEEFLVSSIDFTANQTTFTALALCALTWLVGFVLIICELKKVTRKARNSACVLITGLPGTSNIFPINILSKAEQELAREPVELSVPESRTGDHADQVERYNAELCVDLFKRFILHDECSRVYIGGLARIPFLVSYGAFLRNITSQITYFDKFHRDGSWRLLDDEDTEISLADYQTPTPNDEGDVGIAVGFSAPIKAEQLPRELLNNTVIVRPNTDEERNLIVNQDNLEGISEKLINIVDSLSTINATKRIHLFLSVQTTLAIEMGRRFQEGMHKNWVIHNFNAQSGRYEWAIELSSEGIKEYKTTTTDTHRI